MRLPFGLGRRSSSGNGASGGSSDAGSPTVSRSAASGSGAVPARPRAWASLPPIQRTAGAMPMVAAPGAFVDGLSGTQGLPPVVQQLGHEVSPMATPGLVVARVRAVEQSAGAVPAPVQRRARRSVQRQADSSDSAVSFAADEPEPMEMPLAAAAPPPTVSRSVAPSTTSSSMPSVARSTAVEGASTSTVDDEMAAVSVPAPDIAPVRSLPTVSRSAIRIPDRPLTSAASAVRPVAQRSHAGHSHPSPAPDGASTSAPLPAPSGGMRRAPSSTVIARSAMPTASRQATAAPGAPTAPAPSATPSAAAPGPTSAGPTSASSPSLPTLAPAPSRRGVGEPTSLPAAARPIGAASSPVVSRSTMAGPMPLATSAIRTTVQRMGDGGEDGEEDEGAAPVQRSTSSSGGSAPPSLPTLPVLPVSRIARDGAGAFPTTSTPSTGSAPGLAGGTSAGSGIGTGITTGTRSGTTGTPAGAGAGMPIQRSTSPAIRPIAAHNPLRPSIPIQRETDDEPGDGDEGDGAFPSPWWAPPLERPAGSPAVPGAGLGAGPAIQRSAIGAPAHIAASPSPVTAMRSSAAGTAWASPGVQRSTRSAAGSPGPQMPLALPAAAAATPGAASGGVPDWSAPGTTVVFPQRSITSEPVVQTSRSSSPTYPSPTPSSPTVQREGGTSSSTTTSTATSSGASAPKAPPSERDLDELARALFGRIRTRLRADLLQDREAAGFTFDNV